MIKKLRRRFILAAMCAILIVLEGIMCTVNVANYVKMQSKADMMTELIAKNGGKLEIQPKEQDIVLGEGSEVPPNEPDPGVKMADPASKRNRIMEESRRQPDFFSPETPYETRFFIVNVDEAGEIMSVDVGKIAAVSEGDAEIYAQSVLEKQSETGFEDIYRYRTADTGEGTMIIFLDCRQELVTFRTFARNSLGVSGLGLLAVFVLVVIFSKIVFRPVAESYRKQKQFITDASHELKTPLTIIDANTEVLEMENGENRWTKSTRKQVQRLTSLTQQLITLSKLDEDGIIQEKKKFCLSDALAEAVQPFESLIEMQQKQLELQVEEGIFFSGDEKTIRQMLDILIDNAVKYSPAESQIRVSLQKKENKVVLEVFNRTEEIPRGNLECIFERFYRLDAARNSEQGGSGIGLSVARAVVMAHRGKISAYSEDGQRILVRVVL